MLQESDREGERDVDHEVEEGRHDPDLEGLIGPTLDVLGPLGQLLEADHRGQGAVLDQRHELARQGRQDPTDRLGQDHALHGLGVGQPEGARGLHLAGVNALDPGPHDLGDIARGEARERGDRGPEALEPEGLANEEVPEHDLNQERGPADQLDIDRAEPAEVLAPRDAQEADADPEGQRQAEAEAGDLERQPEALDQEPRSDPREEARPVPGVAGLALEADQPEQEGPQEPAVEEEPENDPLLPARVHLLGVAAGVALGAGVGFNLLAPPSSGK